jgi:hypothetical protein
MRGFLPFAVVLAALTSLAPTVLGPAAAIAFGAPATLPLSQGFGEPNIAIAPDGGIYVAAPSSSTPLTGVWRSLDGGASFSRAHDTLGSGGDSDVAVDAGGTVYASDLLNDVPVSVSTDRGASFDYVTLSAPNDDNDRQWLAAGSAGTVWSSWKDLSFGLGRERVATSHDAGITWSASSIAGSDVAQAGKIVAANDTHLLIPMWTNREGLRVAQSFDGGATWQSTRAATLGVTSVASQPILQLDTLLFPVLAVDADGTIYFAWSEAVTASAPAAQVSILGAQVHLTWSADGGATWHDPLILSPPDEYAVFPAIAADAPGHVLVAWYEGVPPAGVVLTPDVAAGTQWFVKVASTPNALAPTPSWSSVRATGVIHTGPVCTIGSACIPLANPVAFDRRLLDFFGVAEKADGNVAIAFTTTETPNGAPTLQVVVQTGGPRLNE